VRDPWSYISGGPESSSLGVTRLRVGDWKKGGTGELREEKGTREKDIPSKKFNFGP